MGIARGRRSPGDLCGRGRQSERGRQDRLHWRRRGGSASGKKGRETEREKGGKGKAEAPGPPKQKNRRRLQKKEKETAPPQPSKKEPKRAEAKEKNSQSFGGKTGRAKTNGWERRAASKSLACCPPSGGRARDRSCQRERNRTRWPGNRDRCSGGGKIGACRGGPGRINRRNRKRRRLQSNRPKACGSIFPECAG